MKIFPWYNLFYTIESENLKCKDNSSLILKIELKSMIVLSLGLTEKVKKISDDSFKLKSM